MKLAVPVALALGALASAPMHASAEATQSAPLAPVQARTCKTLVVTGDKVAIRRPDVGEASADTKSRVVRYAGKGERLVSCYRTFNRVSSSGDTLYRACGKRGTDWYFVRGKGGGQIPETCVRRA